MLTKSQAKAFFIIGTAAFSAIFIGLTIDTFQKIPDQTKSKNLTPLVIEGKHLFDSKNCMGCHTIMGEGAYYAPELTKVYDRRGEGFIKAMLKNPESMFPGQRKMTNYNLSDREIEALTQFLKWVGEMDLNGFPAKPDLAIPASNSVASKSAVSAISNIVERPKVFTQMCLACHKVDGEGGEIGPNLDNIGKTRSKEFIKAWLADPVKVKANSKMPKLPLSEEEIESLANYLSSLRIED